MKANEKDQVVERLRVSRAEGRERRHQAGVAAGTDCGVDRRGGREGVPVRPHDPHPDRGRRVRAARLPTRLALRSADRETDIRLSKL